MHFSVIHRRSLHTSEGTMQEGQQTNRDQKAKQKDIRNRNLERGFHKNSKKLIRKHGTTFNGLASSAGQEKAEATLAALMPRLGTLFGFQTKVLAGSGPTWKQSASRPCCTLGGLQQVWPPTVYSTRPLVSKRCKADRRVITELSTPSSSHKEQPCALKNGMVVFEIN